jgi:hypothetical protein
MPDGDLNKAIELSRSSKKIEARELLLAIIKVNSQNEAAWLWYADTFSDNLDRFAAMEQCLQNNPNSQIAKKWLATFKKEEVNRTRLSIQELPDIKEKADEQKIGIKEGTNINSNIHKKTDLPKNVKSRKFTIIDIIGIGIICLILVLVFEFLIKDNTCNTKLLTDVKNIVIMPGVSTIGSNSEGMFRYDGAKAETFKWNIQKKSDYGCEIILTGDINGVNVVGSSWFVDVSKRTVFSDNQYADQACLPFNCPSEGFNLP